MNTTQQNAKTVSSKKTTDCEHVWFIGAIVWEGEEPYVKTKCDLCKKTLKLKFDLSYGKCSGLYTKEYRT